MLEALIRKQYGLHLLREEKALAGAGSDTWFLTCQEGKYVLKFHSESSINHPETEPELCAFLRESRIPACDFLKNTDGRFLSEAENKAQFMIPFYRAVFEGNGYGNQ